MNRYTMEIWKKTGVCSQEQWTFIITTEHTKEFVQQVIEDAQKKYRFSSPEELMEHVRNAYGIQWEEFHYDISMKMENI